jgi:RHH-type proline utilization regulon transcriptional repressor/proline dehydrogenase/delta 1-pyrroline-5-carboxylate dehydrogenase
MPEFEASYTPDDVLIARGLLDTLRRPAGRDGAIVSLARDLIAAIRASGGGFGGVEEMLREYALSTREGLALMVLAEALLRVPDSATADRLIED